MSQLLINKYLNKLDQLRKITGASRETQVRAAFQRLLEDWGDSKKLTFVAEYEFIGPAKRRNRVDGALLQSLRLPFGWWEAKDTGDDLDEEIGKKLRRGYPQDNIIFEDTRTAVLWQNRQETMRCPIDDTAALATLLGLFFGHEPAPTRDFRKAVEQFKRDLPAVLGALRDMIDAAGADNPAFAAAAEAFLKQAKETINPAITAADIREMLIQHILTEEVFANVFGNADFHRENNVAKALYGLEATFFKGDRKFQTLKQLGPYYAAIRSTAAQIGSHGEKQAFLKVIYENFYKVYNAKAADRLGVVYTPNEIVRFMVESADWLCEEHFGKNLIDRNVEILDPATGTGTFIVELLEHFRGQPEKLKYKYANELHANEVAILPYYVANLNIEATYAALTGEYAEFPNLCFVDTLDNIAALSARKGSHYGDLIGGISAENIERVRRQNTRKISVIIGNPPYNANQLNENENNKNRKYDEIDQRIKDTYIKQSTAQKTKLYDMYARFIRWASDRIGDQGIIAFVSNSSFVDARTYDGFRKVIAQDFHEIRIIDLKGNARMSGDRRRREGGNVFDDQIRVGVAVWFCVRRKGASDCRIFYEGIPDYAKASEKRVFLRSAPLNHRQWVEVRPDRAHSWLNLSTTDWSDFLPVGTKEAKAAKLGSDERAIFKLYSLGVVTARDEWVYGSEAQLVSKKVQYLISIFEKDRKRLSRVTRKEDIATQIDYGIKWTRAVKADLLKRRQMTYSSCSIVEAIYRPFTTAKLYFDRRLNEMPYQQWSIFPPAVINRAITFDVSGKPFSALAVGRLPDYHVNGDAVTFPLARIEGDVRLDNITDWALDQFRAHYSGGAGGPSPLAGKGVGAKRRRIRGAPPHPGDPSSDLGDVTKDDIFAYVYAVLHDPVYRETYALNLKREFPRIPFYKGLRRWCDWGQTLLDLHIGYEAVEPFDLTRIDVQDERAAKAGLKPKPILKADRETGIITLDSETQLTGVPALAWTYRLGNRSALDWVLDQHKEKTPKDPTIREKFNTYRFADHKERVVDLLRRVTTVSVRTMEIVDAMRAAQR